MSSKFTKRHYEAIAQAMQEAAPKLEAHNIKTWAVEQGQWEYTIAKLANVFDADNGQFKRERFLHACVPGANVRARS